MTSFEPTFTPSSVITFTEPRRTRPASGTAPAVTEPGTVHDAPVGRGALESVTDTEPKAGLAKMSTWLNVVVPAGTLNPSMNTCQVPAAGLAMVTDSSESPSALRPRSVLVVHVASVHW